MTMPTLLYGRKYQHGVNWITAVAMTAFHVGAVAAFFFIDRGATSLMRLWLIIRDETLWAWVTPRRRDVVNVRSYTKETKYLPGDPLFEKGLAEWEERSISSPPFPESGNVLIGAAGRSRNACSFQIGVPRNCVRTQ